MSVALVFGIAMFGVAVEMDSNGNRGGAIAVIVAALLISFVGGVLGL